MLTRDRSQAARKLAHVSDLHIGRSVESDARAVRLCQALIEARVDHVVVTGDVTHKGRRRELARFEETFAPLREAGRLTVIPGNHDRLGDDARRGKQIARVCRECRLPRVVPPERGEMCTSDERPGRSAHAPAPSAAPSTTSGRRHSVSRAASRKPIAW